MITSSLHGNNRLIRKTILNMYPGSFAAILTMNIALMVDTLLAGTLLGQKAIAAVAIGLPAIGIFQALLQTVVSGTAIKMAIYAGSGDNKKLNSTYSIGLATTAVFGLLFMFICLSIANPLTQIFGGAKNPEAAAQAALYLRASSVCVLMGSLNTFASKILALYGYQKNMSVAAFIAMIGNVVFSILYVSILPKHLAIMGLGAGTWTGGSLAFLYSYTSIKLHKIPLKIKLKDINVRDLPEIVVHGFPTSANGFADNMVAGVINNLIVAGFGGDTTALSIYTAVKSIDTFCITSENAIQAAIAPLMGILYGSRDKSGIVAAVKESFKVSLFASAIWCGTIYLLLPFIAGFYGMQGNPHFKTGVVFGMLCTPIWLVVHILVQVFESTENSGAGLLYSSVPDSVIYPIMLALLLPHLGYNAIWLSYSLNPIPLFIIFYLIRSAKNKTLKFSWDTVLILDKSVRDNVPMMDISVKADNTNVTGISSQIHDFLLKENTSQRTAYITSLCLEELAADFVDHTMKNPPKSADSAIMDIKLFSDTDSLQIVMRNLAPRYNPLDFTLDGEYFSKVGVKLVQKVSRRIEYNYVYRMNIVTIYIDK